jgi:hypothetical protein
MHVYRMSAALGVYGATVRTHDGSSGNGHAHLTEVELKRRMDKIANDIRYRGGTLAAVRGVRLGAACA